MLRFSDQRIFSMHAMTKQTEVMNTNSSLEGRLLSAGLDVPLWSGAVGVWLMNQLACIAFLTLASPFDICCSLWGHQNVRMQKEDAYDVLKKPQERTTGLASIQLQTNRTTEQSTQTKPSSVGCKISPWLRTSFIFFSKKNILCMGVCLHVCLFIACMSGALRSQRGSPVSQKWSYRWLQVPAFACQEINAPPLEEQPIFFAEASLNFNNLINKFKCITNRIKKFPSITRKMSKIDL